MPTETVRTGIALVAAAVAAVLHVLLGYLYLVSGLAVPFYALLPLWAWWFVLAHRLVLLAQRRSPWVLAVPVVAAGTWFVVVLLGGELLGWTA